MWVRGPGYCQSIWAENRDVCRLGRRCLQVATATPLSRADAKCRGCLEIAKLGQVLPNSRLHDCSQLHRHLLFLDELLQRVLEVVRKGDGRSFHASRVAPIGVSGADRDESESSSGPSDDRSEYAPQEAAQLRRRIAELDADMFSLSQADKDCSAAADWFWNRARHERGPH
jgi:hypothetical protein